MVTTSPTLLIVETIRVVGALLSRLIARFFPLLLHLAYSCSVGIARTLSYRVVCCNLYPVLKHFNLL